MRIEEKREVDVVLVDLSRDNRAVELGSISPEVALTEEVAKVYSPSFAPIKQILRTKKGVLNLNLIGLRVEAFTVHPNEPKGCLQLASQLMSADPNQGLNSSVSRQSEWGKLLKSSWFDLRKSIQNTVTVSLLEFNRIQVGASGPTKIGSFCIGFYWHSSNPNTKPMEQFDCAKSEFILGHSHGVLRLATRLSMPRSLTLYKIQGQILYRRILYSSRSSRSCALC